MCRKYLRGKVLDKYKVETPRLNNMYASAHRLQPTDLAILHPGAPTPFPLQTLSLIAIFMCTHIHTFFQHLYFPQHGHRKLFLNFKEAQVTNTLAPTHRLFSRVSRELPSRQLISLWPGSSAPMIVIRLHFQQSRRPLSVPAPAKSSSELSASSLVCQHPGPEQRDR